MHEALPTCASATTRSSTSSSWLFSAFAIADCRHLRTSFAIRLRENSQIGERGRDLLAADQPRDQVELLRADPEHPGHRLGLVVCEAALVRFLAHRYP